MRLNLRHRIPLTDEAARSATRDNKKHVAGINKERCDAAPGAGRSWALHRSKGSALSLMMKPKNFHRERDEERRDTARAEHPWRRAGRARSPASEGAPPAYVTRTTHWGISLDTRWPPHRGADLHSSTGRGGPAKSGPPAGPVGGPCAGQGFTSGSVEVHTPSSRFQGSRRKSVHALLIGARNRALPLDRRRRSGHLDRTRATLHGKGSRLPSGRRRSLFPWLLGQGKPARGRWQNSHVPGLLRGREGRPSRQGEVPAGGEGSHG
jgi:hypothetical protein